MVARRDGERVAATGQGREVWEYSGERGWVRVPLPDDGVAVASLLLAPDGETLYAGTEPGSLYRKRWREPAWELVCTVHRLPLAAGWHTPWGGPAAVRTLAAGRDADYLYLDIHVGGILRTRDGGRTWVSVDRGLEEDVHDMATHPLAPARVYAATADGFYLSEDEGDTWQRRNQGLENRYCRGIAVHPREPNALLISGSPFPPPAWRRHGPQFGLFRSDDAGRSWRRIREGLPDPSPAVIDTRCIAFSRGRPDCALLGAGSALYASDDAGRTWQCVADGLPEVRSVVGA